VGWLLVSTQPIYVQESPGFEKIADLPLDQRFRVRIPCVGDSEDHFEEPASSMFTQSILSQRSGLKTEI
jgi:hypothetical protein